MKKINPYNYELVENHNYCIYLDASNFYKCKKTGNIYTGHHETY